VNQEKTMKKRQLGQGMTEYIIIVALISVAAIGVYSYFAKTVRNQVSGLAAEMSGKSAGDSIEKAQTAASMAKEKADADYTLANYNEGGNEGGGNAAAD